jgi:hypothetical protein
VGTDHLLRFISDKDPKMARRMNWEKARRVDTRGPDYKQKRLDAAGDNWLANQSLTGQKNHHASAQTRKDAAPPPKTYTGQKKGRYRPTCVACGKRTEFIRVTDGLLPNGALNLKLFCSVPCATEKGYGFVAFGRD